MRRVQAQRRCDSYPQPNEPGLPTGPTQHLGASMPHTRRTVRVDGQDLAVEITGTGRPLLLCNGIGTPLETWKGFTEALGDLTDRTLVTFDAPGVGASPLPRIPYTMRGLADLVAALMDELGYREYDLLGVSLGGALAQEITIRHPRKVRRLVLVSTLCGGASVPAGPKVMAEMLSPRRHQDTKHLAKTAPWLYGGNTRRNPEAALDLERLKRRTGRVSTRGYLYQMLLWTGWTSALSLPRTKTPVLVLSGNDDPIVPTANAHILAALCKNSTLVIVEGGGHLLLWDDAVTSARTVESFLAQ